MAYYSLAAAITIKFASLLDGEMQARNTSPKSGYTLHFIEQDGKVAGSRGLEVAGLPTQLVHS